MIIQIIQALFLIYTILLFVRILGSWVPQLTQQRWMQIVHQFTDPYLNLFRRFIPPLGVLDISPMVAFFALQIGEQLILFLLRMAMRG
jgi:YggT family protein